MLFRSGKAPSTLSHAARQLETRYDALLFDRRRYRLELTPAGRLLAEEAERLLADMGRLNTRVRQVASGWEDRLAIVTDELLEFQTLLPLITDFDRLKSGVGLRITHEVLGGTWNALREGRADLVIGSRVLGEREPGAFTPVQAFGNWLAPVQCTPRPPGAAPEQVECKQHGRTRADKERSVPEPRVDKLRAEEREIGRAHV